MNNGIAQLKTAFLNELPAIDRAIQASIRELPPLVQLVTKHVMNAGGKVLRSEERRVGKECRSRWSPYH